MSNRLADTTSPYLLQHKDNPVHWYAWGRNALEQARSEGKPIILSIGYAACHWCHVMAHESFEDERIANLMNTHFINIKIDREERPDLDTIYQGALALMGQPGGWPLTMFCRPDGQPFAGGTYFPPESRYGRPGFPDVLKQIARIWRDEPDRITASAGQIMEHLDTLLNPEETGKLSMAVLDDLAEKIARLIDPAHGGLGGAPKFPNTPALEFVWRAYLRTGSQALKTAVTNTLTHMCQGGIYDHLGGGFARYSVDDHWLVPHFEKMLYDNAQIVSLLTMVWQTTQHPLYAQRVEETIDWALRELKGDATAFYSSLDADSEGEEGKFYVWTAPEIERVLGPENAAFFGRVYGVSPQGNFEGKTILNRLNCLELLGEDEEARLKMMREKLLEARSARIRPNLDDKILADWNGLMVDALARAGAIFGREDWIGEARKAFDWILFFATPQGANLAHSSRGGSLGPSAMADDYANLLSAAITLWEVTCDDAFPAVRFPLTLYPIEKHFRAPGGGFYQTADDADDIIVRSRTIYDNATPPANGVMLANYARLYAMEADPIHAERAEEIVRLFSGIALKAPSGTATFLNAVETFLESETIVVQCPDARYTDDIPYQATDIFEVISRHRRPNTVVSWFRNGASIPSGHPAHGKKAVDGKTTVYVCRGRTCSLPITSADELEHLLANRSSKSPRFA